MTRPRPSACPLHPSPTSSAAGVQVPCPTRATHVTPCPGGNPAASVQGGLNSLVRDLDLVLSVGGGRGRRRGEPVWRRSASAARQASVDMRGGCMRGRTQAGGGARGGGDETVESRHGRQASGGQPAHARRHTRMRQSGRLRRGPGHASRRGSRQSASCRARKQAGERSLHWGGICAPWVVWGALAGVVASRHGDIQGRGYDGG